MFERVVFFFFLLVRSTPPSEMNNFYTAQYQRFSQIFIKYQRYRKFPEEYSHLY